MEKIKSIKCDYRDSVGPSETVTLGIKDGDISVIFGTFYLGPHMTEAHGTHMAKIEQLIDRICNKA